MPNDNSKVNHLKKEIADIKKDIEFLREIISTKNDFKIDDAYKSIELLTEHQESVEVKCKNIENKPKKSISSGIEKLRDIDNKISNGWEHENKKDIYERCKKVHDKVTMFLRKSNNDFESMSKEVKELEKNVPNIKEASEYGIREITSSIKQLDDIVDCILPALGN